MYRTPLSKMRPAGGPPMRRCPAAEPTARGRPRKRLSRTSARRLTAGSRNSTLRQHGSARVLSLPYLRRCHGVATSLDYQNATLKIVSGRLGSPSGRSGRLRGVIAKSPGQTVGGAAGVRPSSACNASRTAVSSWGSRPAAQSCGAIVTSTCSAGASGPAATPATSGRSPPAPSYRHSTNRGLRGSLWICRSCRNPAWTQ